MNNDDLIALFSLFCIHRPFFSFDKTIKTINKIVNNRKILSHVVHDMYIIFSIYFYYLIFKPCGLFYYRDITNKSRPVSDIILYQNCEKYIFPPPIYNLPIRTLYRNISTRSTRRRKIKILFWCKSNPSYRLSLFRIWSD